MSTVSIPRWNSEGVLPPIDSADPTSASRSPYQVALADFVLHFGTSEPRCAILDGLLRYRAALHAAGLVEGFQWINGSFLEHVEVVLNRPPNDVDVVTFYRLPAGATQKGIRDIAPDLFDHDSVKQEFRIDGYLVHLDQTPKALVERSAYWYSLWSHRRDRTWKGFIEIGLAADDAPAAGFLKTLAATGGQP